MKCDQPQPTVDSHGKSNFRCRLVKRVFVVLCLCIAVSFLTNLALNEEINASNKNQLKSAQQTKSENPTKEKSKRPRAKEIGIHIGLLPTGENNAITDVPGVKVGHVTLNQKADLRTGVTVILPHDRNLFQEKVPAAIEIGNGFGKLVGISQVAELGTLETPIALTNTLSVFRAAEGLVEHTLNLPGNEKVRSVNPVAGETNDGYLNNIRARRVKIKHVLQAIKTASTGPVAEGCVGAGTGTRCFGFKGGIGTASRKINKGKKQYTLGVLVQSNFGGSLAINGARVGEQLQDSYRKKILAKPKTEGGSCMIVVATDAPLDARQLKRIAKRALLGLGAIGSAMSHGSGDYVIAFSTVGLNKQKKVILLEDKELTTFFQATKEATEEAVLNSLLKATTTTGRDGHQLKAISIKKLLKACDEYRAVAPAKKSK